MKNIIFTFFALWGMSYSFSQTSNCQPIFVSSGNNSLCQGDDVNFNLSFSLPLGCAFADPITPFTLHKPNNIINILLAGVNVITETNALSGNYYISTVLVNDGMSTCPCGNNVTLNSNQIFIKPLPVSPIAVADVFTCGDNIELNVTNNATSNIGTYMWYNLNGDYLYSGNGYNPGNIFTTTSFEVLNSLNGCESSRTTVTAAIDVLTSPSINSDTTLFLPCNSSISVNASSSEGGVQWYSDNNLDINDLQAVGNQFTTVVGETNQIIYAVSANGYCKSLPVPVALKVIKPLAPVVDNINSCRYENVVQVPDHNSTNSLNGLFQWTFENQVVHIGNIYDFPTSIINTTGTYTYEISEVSNSCVGYPATMNLTINGLPSIFTNDNYISICEGEDIELKAFSLDSIDEFYWSTPYSENDINNSIVSILNVIESIHEGQYYSYALDFNGCYSEKLPVTLQVIPSPNIGLSSLYEITDGDELALFASDIDSVFWSPSNFLSSTNIVNPIFRDYPSLSSNLAQEFTYILEGYDLNNNCSKFDTTIIRVKPFEGNGLIKVYDVFTPNGDDFNDFWYIDYLYNLTEYEISVYDKSNKIVYYHNSADGSYDEHRWNGGLANDDSAILPTGTYRYVIHAPGSETVEPLRGQVTLLH